MESLLAHWGWLHLLASPPAIVHALLYKRDPRAALGWIGLCAFLPLAGPLLYFLFGINRIRTRAREIAPLGRFLRVPYEGGEAPVQPAPLTALPPLPEPLRPFVQVSQKVARRPLLGGNRIDPLVNGDAAYPAMLAAIDQARERVFLATYLFETDPTGRRFIDALARARRRGVAVRVLVDAVGEHYDLPTASRLLRRAGVSCARFLPPRLLPPTPYLNLRNHRKLLVVDGHTGFTGGMNIGERHLVTPDNPRATRDLHFRLQGPVVRELEDVFREDWHFATGESLAPSPMPPAQGESYARVIVDGPNEDMDKLLRVLQGTLGAARHEIVAVTPYFVPPEPIVTALQAAALRGVAVHLILPERSNIPYVDWACRNLLLELLTVGVQVHYQPPPFDHSKLLLIDGRYAHIGSANLDSRSLRLNFELNVEIADPRLVARLNRHAQGLRQRARTVSRAEIEGRPLGQRLRDATCWLFSPYL